jgi:hypothetical protein
MHGEAADWSVDTHLLALLADIGQIAIWQPTENGHKGRNPPAPLRRPGDVEKEATAPSTGRSIEETRALLDKATSPKAKPKKRATKGTVTDGG